jgi:hypothetical protein
MEPSTFPRRSFEDDRRAMTLRIRHCIECPKCNTRYLIGFSPYRNGSQLMPLVEGGQEGWILYCSCGKPPSPSRWSSTELKMYAVSDQAHGRGYGPPEEIVRAESRAEGSAS